MSEPTPGAYEAAIDYLGRHIDIDPDSDRWLLDDKDVRGLVAAVGAAGVAAGRAQAAADIRAHADKWAPADGNFAQQRVRRHLGIAERVAAGPPTAEEIAKALNEFFAERAEGGEPRG